MLASCILAFSLYSRLPMPRADWNRENLRWVLCFFPLVGVVIGVLEAVVFWAARALNLGLLCTAAFQTVLPLLVTGGIHLDGFMDTVDALSAHTDSARRREILQDSRVGAFAVTGCGVCLVLMLGIWSEVDRGFPAAAACFFLSRTLTGLLVVTLPAARGEGMIWTLKQAAPAGTVRFVLIGETVLAAAVLLFFGRAAGAAMTAAALLAFFGCRRFFAREFGGISGDPAGFFLQICELLQLLVLILLQGRMG